MEKMNAVIAFLRECATKLTDLAVELEKEDTTPVEVPEKKSKKKKRTYLIKSKKGSMILWTVLQALW